MIVLSWLSLVEPAVAPAVDCAAPRHAARSHGAIVSDWTRLAHASRRGTRRRALQVTAGSWPPPRSGRLIGGSSEWMAPPPLFYRRAPPGQRRHQPCPCRTELASKEKAQTLLGVGDLEVEISVSLGAPPTHERAAAPASPDRRTLIPPRPTFRAQSWRNPGPCKMDLGLRDKHVFVR